MKKFIVISHTHWDREWYMNFQSFRLKLVDLIDRLFPILDKDPDYIFHLDAQTVVLEDYLEIRPENEDKLKRYIASGNIRVGPWYLQNDFFLTSGEATVRNLQVGRKLAAKFGRCGKVGYAPDQFGNISQLPQILHGFGIDTFVFGRGYRYFNVSGGEVQEELTPAEFVWKGADGSECLAVHLKLWYNNAQRLPGNIDEADGILEFNEKAFENRNVSPYILLMNGVDHLEAQDDLFEVMAKLRERGRDIAQCGLDEYTDMLRASVEGKELVTVTGALDKGHDYDLLKGCWSSRIHLKRENVRAQDLLQNELEPLYTYLIMSGMHGAYPAGELTYLWKSLMKNHPHDSICGCSVDNVHTHMADRYLSIREMGEDLLHRGMKLLAHHAAHPFRDDKNYLVALFNPTEKAAEGVCRAEIYLPISENITEFSIVDGEGNDVEYEITSREKALFDVFSPLNLPGTISSDKLTVEFCASVPALSPAIYAIVPFKVGKAVKAEAAGNSIENERYKITFDGGLVIEDKKTGKVYQNPLVIEDTADKGDAYVYRKSKVPAIRIKPEFCGIKAGSMTKTMSLAFNYDCPARYDFHADTRSEETVKEAIKADISIEKNSDVIKLSYEIDNAAEDHRIRLIYALGNGRLFTDSAFDFAEKTDFENCAITDSNTHCNATFCEIKGTSDYSVYTEGQHEAEVLRDGLAMTILRSTGWINRDCDTFEPTGGKCWRADGNQMIGKTHGRMGLVSGSQEPADAFINAKFFRTGFLTQFESFDPKKFAGGRYVVQGGAPRFYYVKDKYAGIEVGSPFFSYEGEGVVLTCCRTDDGGNAIVRLVNILQKPAEVTLNFNGSAELTDLAEELHGRAINGGEKLVIAPKKIVTLRIFK